MTEERLIVIKQKHDFVKAISDAIGGKPGVGVESVEYHAFKISEDTQQEYVLVNYKGGAIAARNVNGDSLSAIFEEIAKMLDGGCYDEVRDYVSCKDQLDDIDLK